MHGIKQRLFSFFTAAGFFGLLSASESHQIKLSLDKSDGVYKKGDTVRLSIDYRINGKPADGVLKIHLFHQNGTQTSVDFPVSQKVFATELKSGTIRFVVEAQGADGKVIRYQEGKQEKTVSASIGVIADPEEIRPILPEPADFQQFWDQARAELAKVPMKVKRTEAEVPKARQGEFQCWDVQVDCAGNAPVSGYLTLPVKAEPKSLPAVVSFQGGGVYSGWKQFNPGAIVFNINAHGIANGQPKSFYAELSKTKLLNYWTRNSDSRDQFYFRNMFLRVQRALDFVKTLPEYDGKTLIVFGSSQGGAQALVAAGMDPDVVLVGAQVPSMGDLGGILAGRPSGWPRLIEVKDGKVVNPEIVKTLPYYDMAFFAKRIRAEVYFTVGLIDTTCCPTSVYAAFNCVPGRKHMTTMPDEGHTGKWDQAFTQRIQDLTRPRQKK